MRSKLLTLLGVIGIVGAVTYSCVRLSPLYRFPGDSGEMYDRWEAGNETFKVRMTAYYEVGIYMPGAFYTCEAAPVGSDEWREFKAFRGDDAIPLSRLNQRFRFVNAQTAYFYTADEFLSTVDGGRTWSVWEPILTQPDGGRIYWAITQAHVEGDGTGKAMLWSYDEQKKQNMSLEASTKDYGQSWEVAKDAAKHNNGMHPTADTTDFKFQ